MLGAVVGLPVDVIGAAMAGAAGFRFARVGHGEFVPGMAVIALVLIRMAHGAAFSNLTLRHARPDIGLDVGAPIQHVRRTTPWPLVLRPEDCVALGLALGVFHQMAAAARIGCRHLEVNPMIRRLLRVDVHVAVDAAHFLQVLFGPEFA